MLNSKFKPEVDAINKTKSQIIELAKDIRNGDNDGIVDKVFQIGFLLDRLETQSYNYGYEYSKDFYNGV